MLFSKRILVLLDSGSNSRNALIRAHLIAERVGSVMELVWVGKSEPWTGLEEQLAALDRSGLRYERAQLEGDLIDDLKARWEQDHFALLVKGCDPRHDSASLLAPRDWKLLRNTLCPVLLVKRDLHWAGGRILAALNPVTQKDSQQRHNQSILLLAAFIGHATQAKLHLAIATPAAMQGAEPEMQAQPLIDQRARAGAQALQAQLGLAIDQLHIGEGPPEHWIPRVTADIDASLVVIGTHARKGVKGALLGNTAERILDRLDTDILVLRAGLEDALSPLVE